MWIKNENEATSRLYDAELDVAVAFNSNGTAQVPKDVGEQLVARYEAIQAHETTADSDGDSDSDGDDDAE